MSMTARADAVANAQAVCLVTLSNSNKTFIKLTHNLRWQYLWFPCGVIRGGLAIMGITATVQAETSDLPGATFQIKTSQAKSWWYVRYQQCLGLFHKNAKWIRSLWAGDFLGNVNQSIIFLISILTHQIAGSIQILLDQKLLLVDYTQSLSLEGPSISRGFCRFPIDGQQHENEMIDSKGKTRKSCFNSNVVLAWTDGKWVVYFGGGFLTKSIPFSMLPLRPAVAAARSFFSCSLIPLRISTAFSAPEAYNHIISNLVIII